MEWQRRPLEAFYPVIYLDAIRADGPRRPPGAGDARTWIVLGFVEGWLCRGGCRGGGGVVAMVAVFGGGG